MDFNVVLPKELVDYIFTFVDINSLFEAARVSKHWNVLSSSEWLWRFHFLRARVSVYKIKKCENLNWKQSWCFHFGRKLSSSANEDCIIHRLTCNLQEKLHQNRINLSAANIEQLINHVVPIISKDPIVLRLTPPIVLVANIHSNFLDLIRIFEIAGFPPKTKYLFIGNMIGKGLYGVECISLLYALKIKYPEHIYLLRGKHETSEVNHHHRFFVQCKNNLNIQIFKQFNTSFSFLPMAAIIGSTFVVHSGLSKDMNSLKDLEVLERPLKSDSKIIIDLLWSNASDGEAEEWGFGARGISVCWNYKAFEKFLEMNNLTKMINTNFVSDTGIEYMFNGKLITLFSSSNYNGGTNSGSLMVIEEDGTHKFLSVPFIPKKQDS